jgi:hypothetical protein
MPPETVRDYLRIMVYTGKMVPIHIILKEHSPFRYSSKPLYVHTISFLFEY